MLNALTTGRCPPYMNSKLTRILCDSLGGNCKTSLICGGRPDLKFGNESATTLRFGANAKKIRNKVFKNEILSIKQYQKRHAAYEEKIKNFEAQLKQAEKIKKYTSKLEEFAVEQGLDVTAWAAQSGLQTMDEIRAANPTMGSDSDSEEKMDLEGQPGPAAAPPEAPSPPP